MRFEFVCKKGHQFGAQLSPGSDPPAKCIMPTEASTPVQCRAAVVDGIAMPLPDEPFADVTGGWEFWSVSVTGLVEGLSVLAETAAGVSIGRTVAHLYEAAIGQAIWDFCMGLHGHAAAKLAPLPEDVSISWEDLRIDLTQEQLAASAREMANVAARIDALEDEKKAAAADFKGRLEVLGTRLSNLGAGVREGHRVRIETLTVKDWSTGTVTTVRRDTGAVIRERAMTAEERQPSLPLNRKAPEEIEPEAEVDTGEDLESFDGGEGGNDAEDAGGEALGGED